MPRFLTLCLLLFALPAVASDGVLEINQTCATQGGCFAGDADGFPVGISTQGSYVLTSDLVVAAAATSGIVISASEVSLDLNGFTIRGPVSCSQSGTALTCTPSTTGWAIEGGTPGTGPDGVVVHDGRVRGFGSGGIILAGSHARLERVTAIENGDWGIFVGPHSLVLSSTAIRNDSAGISTDGRGVVSNNTVAWNRNDGIAAGNGSSVVGNAADGNGNEGIDCAFGCVVRDNAASDNQRDGIRVGSGTLVSDNAVYSNDGDGIEAGTDCTVQRNIATDNLGWGLRLNANTAYRENVVTTVMASTGTVTGGVNLLANSCNGAVTCP